MENKITGEDILQLGIEQGPIIGELLSKSNQMIREGKERMDALKAIKELHAKIVLKENQKLRLREEPLNIKAAIEITSKEEEENLKLSLTKIRELSLCPVVEAATLMPDTCPAGLDFGSIPVGGAIQTNNHIIPAAHSSDLCCSVMATIFSPHASPKAILDAMESSTLFGPTGRDKSDLAWHQILEEKVWDNPFLKNLESVAHQHLQTQGDGNHFFYLGKLDSLPILAKQLEENGYYDQSKGILESGLTKGYVLITHHGSRNLGAQIYKRGIEAAIKETNKVATDIPKNLAWLDIHTPLGTQYWQALEYAQRWTIANHTLIHSKTLQRIEQTPIATISNAHNFVWEHKGKIMHGKGATPAWLDPLGRKSLGIIPLNMSSEILITLGSNNTDFLSFSPHGAGRNKSRSALMENYKDKKTKELDRNLIEKDFKNATLGLDIRWASKKIDISECPIGYKNKEMIKLQLKNFNLATLVSEVQPMGCIMAGEFEMPWNIKKKKKPIPLEMPTP